MSKPSFKILPQSSLGIDVGVSCIKLTELSRWGQKTKLKNYGEISVPSFYEEPFRTFEKRSLSLFTSDIAQVIKAIVKEAQIKTRQAVFTIPDFSTFFTNFKIPSMSEKELEEAVRYEARRHVPVPLKEVSLDWSQTGTIVRAGKEEIGILLVAVPRDIIYQYQQVAKESNIQLQYLEAEVFSLIRALSSDQPRTEALIDMGAQSTTINIVQDGDLKMSHSLDVSGNRLTIRIAKELGVDNEKAEALKKKYGIDPGSSSGKRFKKLLHPLINSIIMETQEISRDFYRSQGAEIQKVILAGGSVSLPGLKEFLNSKLKTEIEIANPFSSISSPSILKKTLKNMGPRYAVSVGAALRGIK